MKLYCGQPVPVPAANAPAGFVHPDAQRRFHLVDSQAALRLALEYPWERWTVFLHPDQREVVARDYSGPALVTGSAGTGKSVVAIHRAARLLGENPEARVLLTSYSRTLAIRLAQHMKCVLPPDDPSWQRLDVVNVHRLAADLWRNAHGSFQPVSDDGLNRYLEAAADRQSVTEFPRRFLRSEWDTIIDPWDVDSWERYRNIPRIGRGTPLGARQRFALWSVFDDVRQQLSAKSEMTWDGLCYRVAETLDDAPYEHVVADECQDLGPAELRLLQALAPADGVNNLFLTGDSGQQIYRRGFSWLAAGIDVRGRARRLRVNYRTTEQIRRFADALLADATREPNEDTEERASVSLLYGPPPDLYAASDPAEESEYLSAWLAELFTDGFEPQHVGIFARTKGILEERVAPALLRLGRATHTLSDDDPPSEGLVSVGTMHRAKGLEFRAVAVVGCDAAVLPLSFALKSVGDAGDLDEIVAQERHLLYVACTRAQRRLLVSWAGKPSAFLDIDVVHVGAPEPAPSRDQEEGTQDD
jgi:superfamily I DNA/RNA helicase